MLNCARSNMSLTDVIARPYAVVEAAFNATVEQWHSAGGAPNAGSLPVDWLGAAKGAFAATLGAEGASAQVRWAASRLRVQPSERHRDVARALPARAPCCRAGAAAHGGGAAPRPRAAQLARALRGHGPRLL